MEKLMEEKKTTLWQEIKICRVDETNYPHDLKKIKDRPEVLYYRGNIDILNEHKSIAVVGLSLIHISPSGFARLEMARERI